MIQLRDLENIVCQFYSNFLAYYQPETKRLEESIRIYCLSDVFPNYSHIPRDDSRYSYLHDGRLQRIKKTSKYAEINFYTPAELRPYKPADNIRRLAILHPYNVSERSKIDVDRELESKQLLLFRS